MVSGELTQEEGMQLLDYLEARYPGRVLPEKDMWQAFATHDGTIPFRTDNNLVNVAQKYLGLGEAPQRRQIQFLFEKNGVTASADSFDPTKAPWCAAYVASVLNEAGYAMPNGADKLRARKYASYGVKSEGKVGGLNGFSLDTLGLWLI